MWSDHICLREACFFDAFVLDWGQRTVCRVYKKICALGSKQAGFSKELSYWKETELIHIPHSTLWSICSHGSRFDGVQHVITCYNKSLSDPPMILPGSSQAILTDLSWICRSTGCRPMPRISSVAWWWRSGSLSPGDRSSVARRHGHWLRIRMRGWAAVIFENWRRSKTDDADDMDDMDDVDIMKYCMYILYIYDDGT